MKNREAYILGWVYGRIARTMPAEDTAVKMQFAAQHPLSGFTAVHQAAISSNRLSDDLRADVAAALDELSDAVCIADQTETVLPLELQGSWQLGYYRAKAGQPLPPSTLDIAAARKALGMTQQQLADAVGVTQTMVARWESGKAKPGNKNLAKLKEVLS